MLEAFLRPKSVAVIGASNTPGKVGHAVMANMVKDGFEGELIPVNPRQQEILGRRCYADLGEYGGKVELAVIAVPTAGVIEAVESAARVGARAAVVITAGFKEIGPEGAALERELVARARRLGVRLVGPNCLGILNTHSRLNASFAHHMPPSGGISVISQSGALCTAIIDLAIGAHIGLSALISVGNKADLNETDFLKALAEDDSTRVIVGYLEDITQGNEFIKAAEAVAAVKPVVLLKVGTTQAGKKAASSHTGSLAGADMAYGAAFRRAGVVRAETYEQLFDIALGLSMQPLPAGRRVAIITNAGGPGIIAADAVENAGLEVARLTEETTAAIRAKLPAAASVQNPIDVLGDADAERYVMAAEAAERDPHVDAIMTILVPVAITPPEEIARALTARLHSPKPVLTVFMGAHDVVAAQRVALEAGLPNYTSPERAAAALRAMCEYGEWKNRPTRVVTRFPVNRRRVERILRRHLRMERLQVGEAAAKDILRAYDFGVPAGSLAASAEQAIEVADRIGFPVAMKIASPDVVHKSDMGGVKLNLASPGQVRDAYDLMMLRITQKLPDARIDGVYIEKMCRRGREVIIGMSRDAQFGPMLMFGLGGIFVEVMKDVTFHLAPITAKEAMQMLKSTRSYALLQGARGEIQVDLEGIASGLQRISQLATDFPEIQELDINPFIVREVGIEPMVADARILLRKRGAE
ncbi:MAG: acetate--CoA ligase family protein [Planctomycetes bacterium]|nr:acetate--CoA ligase family protein [Planctomycetota bacterium]